MNKIKFTEYLDENLDYFLAKLIENYKFSCIGGDCDSKDECSIISKDDFKRLFRFTPCNLNYYKSYNCGCEYDCCGCLSSMSICISVCSNNYVAIYTHSSFNY